MLSGIGTVRGDWGRNSGLFGIGLNVRLADRMNFRIGYDYEIYEETEMGAFGTTLGVYW